MIRVRWFAFHVLLAIVPGIAISKTLTIKHSAPYFNVLDYGARNDGSGSCTEAFHSAIEAAHKAGGGTVYVPAGTYTSGPIEMVSNLTLFVDAGATIRFPATNLPFTKGRQQGIEALTPVPLIGGHDLENVAVVGRGTLTTKNEDWINLHHRALRTVSDLGSANGPNWERLLQDLNAGKQIPEEEYRAAASELRPSFIRFMNCKNILIRGLHIVGSPMWTIHLLYSENAAVEGMVIETFPGVHADGIAVDSSRFIRIDNDYIDAGDDGIVIKSGKDADGLRVNRPSENITIANCTVHHAQGAVVVGSETSGSVRNVVASNITARDTVNGIHIKSRRGRGGMVEDISFNNWTMENVGAAITFSDAGYQMEGEPPDLGEGPVTRKTPVFRNLSVSNVTINGAHTLVHVDGIPEMPITGVRITNVTGSGRVGLMAEYTNDLQLDHVEMNVEDGPAFRIAKSSNFEMNDISTSKPLSDTPVVRLEDTPGAVVQSSRAFPGTDIFLSTPPENKPNIQLQGNSLQAAKTAAAFIERPSWPAGAPRTRELCLVQFGRDGGDPTLVSPQSRICLDLIVRDLRQIPSANIALVGNPSATAEDNNHDNRDVQDAITRAKNGRDYLVHAGIDPGRIQLYLGTSQTGAVEDIDKIEAEMVAGLKTEGNVETVLIPDGSKMNNTGLTPID